ncbi:MAG: Fic family protein [candidate division FCPU426 bacterium]
MSETLVPLSSRDKLLALEQAGFKRTRLARLAGVEYMTIYRWFTGASEPRARLGGRIDSLYREHIDLQPLVESLQRPDLLEKLRQRSALREHFFLEATYHSLALAGAKLTWADTREALAGVLPAGALSPGATAALNHREALAWMVEQAVRESALGEAHLLEMHATAMRGEREAAPGRLRGAADGLRGWLEACGRPDSHPAGRAVRLHHAFLRLRPFHRGNGRVGRLLLQAQLLACGLPPALIRVDNQREYEWGLNQADQGDFRYLERVVNEGILRGRRLLSEGERSA